MSGLLRVIKVWNAFVGKHASEHGVGSDVDGGVVFSGEGGKEAGVSRQAKRFRLQDAPDDSHDLNVGRMVELHDCHEQVLGNDSHDRDEHNAEPEDGGMEEEIVVAAEKTRERVSFGRG